MLWLKAELNCIGGSLKHNGHIMGATSHIFDQNMAGGRKFENIGRPLGLGLILEKIPPAQSWKSCMVLEKAIPWSVLERHVQSPWKRLAALEKV